MKLLSQENGKAKPNMETVKELMIRTFPQRRKWILDEEHLVVDICQEYPFLRKQTIVSSFTIATGYSILYYCYIILVWHIAM